MRTQVMRFFIALMSSLGTIHGCGILESISQGNSMLVDWMLSHYPKHAYTTTSDGRTAGEYAAACGFPEIQTLILQHVAKHRKLHRAYRNRLTTSCKRAHPPCKRTRACTESPLRYPQYLHISKIPRFTDCSYEEEYGTEEYMILEQ